MNSYDRKAAELQMRVRHSEIDMRDTYDSLEMYDELGVRIATQHTRDDLVLLLSHASSLNEQVATVRRLLWVVVLMIGYLVVSRLG